MKKGVESHEKEFSNFSKGVPKKITKMLKIQEKDLKTEAKVRVKRFSVSEESEELNVLKGIGKIKEEEKRAIVEFYKSYFRANQEKESLLSKLEGLYDSPIKKRKIRDTSNFENTLNYLYKIKWPNTEIDLSANNEEIPPPPNSLLSSKLFKLMKQEYQKFQSEIKNIEGGPKLGLCKAVLTVLFVASDDCNNKILWLKGNQETLKRAIEFQLLVKLLKEMKRKVPKFDIVYEKN